MDPCWDVDIHVEMIWVLQCSAVLVEHFTALTFVSHVLCMLGHKCISFTWSCALIHLLDHVPKTPI
jgi:hypothetical protein